MRSTRRYPWLAVLATGVLALCGCAPLEHPPQTDREPPVYKTGSNIPTRDRSGVTTVDPQAVQDALRSTPGGSPTR